MRKLFALVLILTFACLGIIEANEDTKTISIETTVNGIFELTVDPQTIDFGNLDPTETSDTKEVEIRGRSNYDNQVYIKQRGENLVSGTNQIVIESVAYEIYHLSGTQGQTPSGTQELTDVYEQIYRSQGNSNNAVDVTLRSDYTLTISAETLVGDYTSMFTITMTE